MHTPTVILRGFSRPDLRRACAVLVIAAAGFTSTTNPPTARGQAPATAKRPPAVLHSLVLEPSQGRPKLLAPGDTFYFVLRLSPDLGATIFVSLVHSELASVRHELSPQGSLSVVQETYGTLVFPIPADAREGLYDIEVRGDGWTHRQPHCVQVVEKFPSKFRFVHLSDMNIDDPSAPQFDPMLPAEVNLLAPAFIVATGDFTEWGRLLDNAGDWTRVLKYFEEFDAPVFIVCGDHDHQASYTPQVANSPLGSFDYGNYHGLLLLDHSAHRLSVDQIQWLRKDLAAHRDSAFNFIVVHNDELDVLDALADGEHRAAYIKEHKLAMVITGGHTDWDYTEFAEKLTGLEGLHYIRTHQSSTALRDRATGVSHYRVIEVDGDQISYAYPDDTATAKAQHSIPVGRLRAFLDGPNDGSRTRVTATIQNALNQRFDNGRIWVRVAKKADAKARPEVAGGRLNQVLDGGSFWLCSVGFDVPDKGGTRVMVSTDGGLPAAVQLSVSLDGPRELAFAPQRTPFGMSYYSSSAELSLGLSNQSAAPIKAWPVVRLNGNVVPIDEDHTDSWPVELPAGESRQIPLRLALGRVSEGEHALQVFFLEDPLKRVTTFPVTLEIAPAGTYDAPAPKPPTSAPAEPTTESAPTTQPAGDEG